MRKSNRVAEADKAEIDLTPMLDVVFIMLIFFIVVASFLKEAGIEMNRPDSNQNPPETDVTSIVVTITGTTRSGWKIAGSISVRCGPILRVSWRQTRNSLSL